MCSLHAPHGSVSLDLPGNEYGLLLLVLSQILHSALKEEISPKDKKGPWAIELYGTWRQQINLLGDTTGRTNYFSMNNGSEVLR